MLSWNLTTAAAIASLALGPKLGCTDAARAQTYPSRAVHIYVGFPAGDPNDIIARLIGQALSERL